jgi:hypothetical protein
MSNDIGFLFVAGIIHYDSLTGRVSTRTGGHLTRQEHPIFPLDNDDDTVVSIAIRSRLALCGYLGGS